MFVFQCNKNVDEFLVEINSGPKIKKLHALELVAYKK
jgi:hypothetical protein